jgi:hypothetical protein
MIGGSAGFASESTETDETAGQKIYACYENDKRSGQVHQETLGMYTDKLKGKRIAGEKLTKKNGTTEAYTY